MKKVVLMNKTLVGWMAVSVTACVSVHGQGSFQNLDFEAARVVFTDPGNRYVATTNALPGWSALSGVSQLSEVAYNAFTFVPDVGLYGLNSLVISGSFGVSLSSRGSISQTGLVPVGSESLLFKGWWPSLSPSVSLGGQGLQFVPLSNAPNYTLYGANIPGLAGQTVSLTFSTQVGAHDVFIDDIRFSPEAIPEPSSLALLNCGGLLLAVHWLMRFRSRESRKETGVPCRK